jgi:hypothetical protein
MCTDMYAVIDTTHGIVLLLLHPGTAHSTNTFCHGNH